LADVNPCEQLATSNDDGLCAGPPFRKARKSASFRARFRHLILRPDPYRKQCAACSNRGFISRPIPTPGPDDWLAAHDEFGQTFEQFKAEPWNKPDGPRRRIYLQPLGEFSDGRSPSQQTLKEYASVFFAAETETLPELPVQAFTSRVNANTNQRQILTTDVLSFLKKNLSHDGFCVLAITMEDLYPEPSWNFAFGEASLTDRVGVCSFARYDPMFYGQVRRPDHQTMLLRRACKVLVHETAHMFGLQHCIFF
jgi:archaemetzincin